MPLSSNTEFPRYPGRQKIESCGHKKFFWQRHGSAGGAWWSFFTSIVPLPSLGVTKRPIPHIPAFHSCLLQVPQLALAASWGFHMLRPSRSPTSVTLLLGVWGGGLHILLSQILGWPLEEAGDLQPQFQQFLQIEILSGCHLSPRLWTPSGRMVLKVGSMAVLWLHLPAPPLSSPRSVSMAVPASRMSLCFWRAPDEGAAQLLYLLL